MPPRVQRVPGKCYAGFTLIELLIVVAIIAQWLVFCYGPDRIKDPDPSNPSNTWQTAEYGQDRPPSHQGDHYFKAWVYAPTN